MSYDSDVVIVRVRAIPMIEQRAIDAAPLSNTLMIKCLIQTLHQGQTFPGPGVVKAADSG